MRISTLRRSLRLAPVMGAGLLFFVLPATNAHATSVTEFPDNGSEQMGRGGAWVARASDPLAAFYNPAGLAGQDTRVLAQANINIAKTCFTRVKAANDASLDANVGPGQSFPQACTDNKPFPNPQLGVTFRLSPTVGLGFAVLGPAAAGKMDWPDGVTAPQRYLLTHANALFFTPTLGIGVEVVPNLRLGASFQWGIANLELQNKSIALNAGDVAAGNGVSASLNDVNATLKAKTLFVPGFTLGALWSASDAVDIAGWYKWSAPIDATGDVESTYKTKKGDTAVANCGDETDPTSTKCGRGDNAHVKVAVPMEAKLGVRFHKLHDGAATLHRRDPMSQDVFDVEVDLTWANNSAFDNLQIRFPGAADGSGIIPVPGTSGNLPPNADVPHHYRDVLGVRVGGDVNVLPDQLALRAGVFYETSAQDKQYQNIDFVGAWKMGLALGGTYRIHFHKADPEKKSALELSAGFGHVFVGEQNNNNPSAAGVAGLAGTACNPASNGTTSGDNCVDASGQVTGQKYRTNWPVNLGTITNSFNMINVGLAYRF
jgi:long-subunit fatty acid transport protein